jgi:GMP reductase
MKFEQDIKLDFSDVLIRPKRSTLETRNDVDLEREFKFPHSNQNLKCIPIIASNMDTVGTIAMYNSLRKYNMLTCFHKFLNIDEYPDKEINDNNYIVSIGIRDEDYEKLYNLYCMRRYRKWIY